MTGEVRQGEPWGRGGNNRHLSEAAPGTGRLRTGTTASHLCPARDEGTGRGKAERLVQSPKAKEVAQAGFHPDLVLGMMPNTPDSQTTFQRENNNDSGRLGVPQGLQLQQRNCCLPTSICLAHLPLRLSPAPSAPEPPLRPFLWPCHLREGSHRLPAAPGGLARGRLPPLRLSFSQRLPVWVLKLLGEQPGRTLL